MPTLDRLGRPQHDPHKPFSGIDGILWIAERVPPTRVPAAFWALDADEGGEPVAIVACPCGEKHIIPLLECPLEMECERYLSFTGKDVWAFQGASAEGRTIVST